MFRLELQNCNGKFFVEQRNLANWKAVQWGRDHENEAVSNLEAYLHKPITRTGVWISTSGVLCASAVGFVNDCVVEVKCYFKSRASSSLKSDLTSDLSFVISYNRTTKAWVLHKDHEYYHQIQGKMYLTNTKECYLVVWIPKDTVILKIKRNDEWKQNVKKMEDFYFEKFIPHLLQSEQ